MSDRHSPLPPTAEGPPIDRDRLAAQTGGDRALEREVLSLFLTKSAADLARLRATGSDAARRAAAHAIVGSARAIGAHEVARLAAAVQTGAGDAGGDIAALAAAIEEANAHIRQWMEE